ncbi:MAG: hypothetical protein L0H29_01360 [Sinobacteraceae bacterium]|nr:hypothetical protein [Nevskiaceae bacterium]
MIVQGAAQQPRGAWWSIPRPASRSVVVWVRDPALLAAAAQLGEMIRVRFPRTPIVFVGAAFAQMPTQQPVCSLPTTLISTRLMLKRLRAQTLIIAGQGPHANTRLFRKAYARGASLVLLHTPGSGVGGDDGRFDLSIDADALTADWKPIRLRVNALIARSRKQTMVTRGRLPVRIRALRFTRRWFAPLLTLKFQELSSVSELRAALGAPDVILCLGNGPSSEALSVRQCAHQRLFRVNMSWLGRGVLARPDLVFTGLAEAVSVLRPTTGFVFGKAQSEEKILGRHLFSSARFRYACCERLGLLRGTGPATSAPTNGALMVAIAAALQPQRLIIAGIDLYADPQGAYPDDRTTANAYDVGHDKHTDIGHMARALRGYRGELVIVGEPLRIALRTAGVESGTLN